MPAGRTAAEGSLSPNVNNEGNAVVEHSGLPMDPTKSDYLQSAGTLTYPEGGSSPSNVHG
jgi:hypothetical protein